MRLGLIPRLRRAASVAALFAILLQLAVAATHYHAVFLGGFDRIGSQQSVSAPQGDDSAPSGEECEICFDLALGSSFVLPDQAPVDLLPASLPVHRTAPQDRERTALLAFHSRAPPAL
jgi:hypothetical protein